MATLQLPAQLLLRNVLFTTDFSEYADRALPYAVGLARHYDSTVFVAHAIPPEPRRPIPLEPTPPELDELRYHAERAMNTFVRFAPLSGVHYQIVLKKGDPDLVFQEMVEDHHIDMVVIATHGRAGLKKFLLGSVAEEIFRTVTCPVLTVGPDVKHDEIASGSLQHVIYSTDFSAASIHALPYAIALAADFRAPLTCVHVLEKIADVPLYYRDKALRDAREELEHLLRPGGAQQPKPEIVVTTGQPAEKILQLAADVKASLIVMGTRSRGSPRMTSHLPWACAHQVLCHAACPVLTVRAAPQ